MTQMTLTRTPKSTSALVYTVMAIVTAAVVLTPIYLVVVTALKDFDQIVADPIGLPDSWIWSNLSEAWEEGRFGRYFRNSLLVTIPTVGLTLTFSLVAAYAFATMNFPFKETIFLGLLGGLTIPLGVLSIPLYYQMLDFGLLDTHLALILPLVGISMPFGTLLLRSFVQDIPRDILDAGRIDGCSDRQLLYHVVVPLARPALLSLLVFIFTWTWNEFLLTVVLLQTENARTLPLGLNFFRGRYSTDYPLLMAGATITFIPVMVVYVLFQRHFTKGIAAGALSGE
jgi:raffinose/stachyose/melibiose transport system permease protein